MKFRNKETKQVVVTTTDTLAKLYRTNPEYEQIKEEKNQEKQKEKK